MPQQIPDFIPDFVPDNVSPRQADTSVPDFVPDTPTNKSAGPMQQMIMDEYNPQPSALSRIWSAMSSPLWEGPSRAGRAVGNFVDKPQLSVDYIDDDSMLGKVEDFGNWGRATMAGFGAGASKGIGDLLSGMTSPIDLGAAALTGGSSFAAKRGFGTTAKILGNLGRVASAPVAAHGANSIYEGVRDEDLGQTLGGVVELAGGGAGMMTPAATPMTHEIPPDLGASAPRPKIRVNNDGTFTDIDTGAIFDRQGKILSLQTNQDLATPTPKMSNPPKGMEYDEFGVFQPIDRNSDFFVKNRPEETPSDMRTFEVNEETGRPNIAVGGADPRVLDVLATSLYTNDMPSTVLKELLQNSLDEMKITNNPNPVKVVIKNYAMNPITKEEVPSVIVKDSGRGLTEDELYTIFTDVGKTGKGNEPDASGGFGFAKAAPLLGGQYAKVESVVQVGNQKIKYIFEGNREQLNNAEKSGVPLKSEVVDPKTPTGLKVQTFFKKEDSLYNAENLTTQIVKGSPNVKNVEIYQDYSRDAYADGATDKFLNNQPLESHHQQYLKKLQGEPIPAKRATVATPGSNIDIHYNLDNTERASGQLVILNNGLFVSSRNIRYAQEAVPHVPPKIVIDIKATVEEGTPNYPFGANREAINQKVIAAYDDWIKENILDPAGKRAIDDIQKLYDGLQPTHGNRFVVHDSGGKYTPEEMTALQTSPVIRNVANTFEQLLDRLTTHFHGETLGDYDKFGFQISSEKHGGINIPNPSVKPKPNTNPTIGDKLRKMKKDANRLGIPESVIDDLTGTPANTRKKYAIMFDPFSAIMNSTNPNDAAQRMVHIIMHEFNHNFVRSEGASYTWSLAKIEGRFPLEERLNAKNAIRDAISGPEGEYAPELQELLRQYQDSRGRPESKPDILSRQRESEWSAAPGQDRTANNSQPNGSGISPDVADGIAKKRSTILLTPNKNSVFDMRHAVESGYKHAGLDEHGRIKMVFTGKPKQVGILETDINNKRGGRSRNPKPQEASVAEEIINFPRAIMASTDFSAPLRQGLPLIHKKAFWTSLDDMFKAWGSENAYNGIMQEINARPLFKKRAGADGEILPSFAEDAGLKLSGLDNIKGREEAIQSTWAEHLPFVRRSNRAYTAFLNKLRADTFENLMSQTKMFMPNSKVDVPLAKELANFVNTASGRGSLGSLESSAKFLNATLFAPRLIASRLQMLNPHYYWTASPMVRKEALKSLLAVAGTGIALGQLAKMVGAEVSSNPTSADFGKIKIGNFRLDPFAGFQQYAVLAARMISGQVQSTTTGNTYNLGEKFGRPTRLDILGRFVEGKANPIISFVTGLLRGKDFVGQPFNIPEEMAARLTPIYLQDLKEILTENPNLVPFYHKEGLAPTGVHPENLPYAVPPAFGMGMQNYGTMRQK